jgi:hypothetical protein
MFSITSKQIKNTIYMLDTPVHQLLVQGKKKMSWFDCATQIVLVCMLLPGNKTAVTQPCYRRTYGCIIPGWRFLFV